jgi:DNA-binding CsgD family transcriptional regulator
MVDLRAEANDRAARALDEVAANVAVLDHQGVIVVTNKAWRKFASDNPLADGEFPRNTGIGIDYLSVCRASAGAWSENALLVCDGIRAVLDGKKKIFCHEYPCHSPDKQRWFQMKVTPLLRSKPKEVVVIHVDITDRRLAEMESWAKQRELGAALAQLQSMAGRIKNSIGAEKFVRLIDAASPAHAQQSQPKVEAGLLKSLSKRELEVLIGLARGERNTDIATRLQLSKKSVSTYRSRVFEKLKVESNAQLATFVERSGLFDDGSS